jgi:peptidoglycan/xylan/chitin deacetylase (PgdA/CDA1 family)
LSRDGTLSRDAVPILLYHSVANGPGHDRWSVSSTTFAQHLDLLVEGGWRTTTVSELAEALAAERELPPNTACVTFDDGFADFYSNALPLLEERGMTSTLYVTTSTVGSGRNGRGGDGGEPGMLAWEELAEIATRNVEIGAHSHHHVELDTLRPGAILDEVTVCKGQLEDRLGIPVKTFAYPHGYSSPRVRAAVRDAGYRSACSVKNALSSSKDDLFSIPRLMLRRDTSLDQVRRWANGTGVAISPPDERALAVAWRIARRLRAAVRSRSR